MSQKKLNFEGGRNKMKPKSSIAIIGSRGIPNNYGGFEGFTEILSENLVKKGYTVHVSCEHPGEKKCIR